MFGLVTIIPMLDMIIEYERSLNECMPLPAVCSVSHSQPDIRFCRSDDGGDRIYYVISVSRASP